VASGVDYVTPYILDEPCGRLNKPTLDIPVLRGRRLEEFDSRRQPDKVICSR